MRIYKLNTISNNCSSTLTITSKNGNLSRSTNDLESINHRLKTPAGAVYLSFDKSCRVLRDFK
jgi:hypothetical protein